MIKIHLTICDEPDEPTNQDGPPRHAISIDRAVSRRLMQNAINRETYIRLFSSEVAAELAHVLSNLP